MLLQAFRRGLIYETTIRYVFPFNYRLPNGFSIEINQLRNIKYSKAAFKAIFESIVLHFCLMIKRKMISMHNDGAVHMMSLALVQCISFDVCAVRTCTRLCYVVVVAVLTREKMLNLQPVFCEQGWNKNVNLNFIRKRMHIAHTVHCSPKVGGRAFKLILKRFANYYQFIF